MPVSIKNKTKILFAVLFWFQGFGTLGQESGSLYYLPDVSQWSMENPAMQNQTGKLVIGMPFLAGTSWQWNSSVPLNSLFSKGFSYSFHRFYDELDEKGKIQTSAGTTLFFANFQHLDYTFSLAVSERGFSEGIFDREIVRIIRDGTQSFYGKNEYLGEASFFLTHYREIAPGISKRLGNDLDVGIRPKILFGKFFFSGENLNLTVETDENQEKLLMKPEGEFVLAGPLIHVRDSLYKSSSFFSDFSPGDYFFQPKNTGVALDLGLVYRPNKFSEFSLSLLDAGLVGFRHKAYDASFNRPVMYAEETTYQSVSPGEEKYLEPRQALIVFGDSVSYIIDVHQGGMRTYSILPFKVNFAGKYRYSEKLTAGFQNQFKYYQLNAVNLFSLFGAATLHPRFTFYGSLSVLNTQGIFPGFGASYNTNWLQIYFTSNNILGIIQPMATKQLNLSFGVNFLFDTH